MKLEFKNHQLKIISEFLYALKLTGRTSRARQKLNKKVSDKLIEFSNDMAELEHEYSDEKELMNAKVELAKETAIIDVSEYKGLMKNLYNGLLDYAYELEGQNSVSHDLVLDELEKYIEDDSEENTNLVEVE